MKYATLTTLALAASFAPSALAHGFLRSITIDGKLYKGNIPNQSNNPSPIRVIDDITPVKGATNRDVNCGKNAKIAAQVVPANPGSVVAFDWASGDDTTWPHNIGPMLTYMSTCGNTTCDQFDAINAKWFKIEEVGQRPNNLSQWVQRDLFDGKTANVTLPNNLPGGDYLIRHEIIALHLGNEKGGAEFYPSCSQIRLSPPSNNTAIQQPSVTVSLPGAYSDTDPGIFVPTVFDPVKNYQFPGPPISNVMTTANVTNAPPSSNATSPVSSSGSSGSSGSSSSSSSPSCLRVRPRKISRVMANFRRVGPTEAIWLL